MDHISVLLEESINGLDIQPTDTFLDGTLGSGGHSASVCGRYPTVSVIGIDRDQAALDRTEVLFKNKGYKATFLLGEFRNLETLLKAKGINQVNRVLFDFGLSSPQIDTSGRGFSFAKDEPLLMTMEHNKDLPTGQAGGVTAMDVVNTWAEETLATIIYGFGEERYSRRIAKAIVTARAIEPITRTTALVDIIRGSVPASYRNGKINPATRTFQAIRIAVNQELDNINEGLTAAWNVLAPGGRIACISFHSLEDRIVKQFFNTKKEEGAKIITKKPITPTDTEISSNPRSRSAKLRIIEK